MTDVQLALTGLELQSQGIASLERHRWVDDARLAAETLLCAHTEASDPCCPSLDEADLTTDDLHDVMGTPPHDNCYGAIFKDKRFVATGERVRSTRPSAHGRWVMVWRLA